MNNHRSVDLINHTHNLAPMIPVANPYIMPAFTFSISLEEA